MKNKTYNKRKVFVVFLAAVIVILGLHPAAVLSDDL